MATLTIRLDDKLDKALDRLARTTGRTKSELAREALAREVAVARFASCDAGRSHLQRRKGC